MISVELSRGETMRCFLTAAAMVCCLAVPVLAQESKSSVDRHIADALREMHDRGRRTYNGGDVAGGYRMYQGGSSSPAGCSATGRNCKS